MCLPRMRSKAWPPPSMQRRRTPKGDLRGTRNAEAMAHRALALLGSRRNDAYEAALAAPHEETRTWWANVLAREPLEPHDGEEPATADAEGLRRFLETEVLPWFETREQAFGEAVVPDRLEQLADTKGASIGVRDHPRRGKCAKPHAGSPGSAERRSADDGYEASDVLHFVQRFP